MRSKGHILIVDDEKNIQKSLKGLFEDEGYTTAVASSGEAAVDLVVESNFGLVFLDLVLPKIDGIETLKKIKKIRSELTVVMMSGHASIENAVKATKLGAYDFVEKPLFPEKILLLVEHILEGKRLEKENISFKEKEAKRYEMVGKSPPMVKLYKEIEKASPTTARVLIYGESGTGKELVARAIHNYSDRKEEPFVKLNCAAIPKELVESELFGYEKGAFTGAATKKSGKFFIADRGTLFLDEIGDMSLETQAKLLRVLEEGEIEPIGSNRSIPVDVRVISATNKDLSAEIKNGNFREDLLYRVNVIPIFVPPLKEKKEDIPFLIEHFLHNFCEENGKRVKNLSSDALDFLTAYDWPGNIRELKNLMERLAIMVPDTTISFEDVSTLLPIHGKTRKGNSLKGKVEQYEAELIKESLKLSNGNIAEAARRLKIDRANLYRKLKQYGIKCVK